MKTMRLCSCALIVLAAWSASAAPANAADPQEAALIAILRSDAPGGEKAIACKKLAIHGSSEAVADLAKLLSDPQLSSWARTALENIPGQASDEALRKAAESLDGRLLVGMINSIGVRRDAGAVTLLTKRLQDKDAADIEVTSAAAVALGRIGTPEAAKVLRASLTINPAKVRSAVAEGCVLCAERALKDGKTADASAIYDEVRKADVPKQRVIEATRGAILARGPEGLPLLVEQLRSADKQFFQLALGTAREFPGTEIDKSLAAELGQAAPGNAALIIQAMADRKSVVLPAIVKASTEGPKEVRLSAISALARVGDVSCLPGLLTAAVDADAELAQTAKITLAELPGEKVDAEIVALLNKADGKSYPLLIELVGQRRIDAQPVLLKALEHSDKAVRSAAFIALGETVPLSGLSVLISHVVSPKKAEDAEAAQKALNAASVRMPDREVCAAELTTAFDSSSAAAKAILIETLANVGGTKALATIGKAAKSDSPEMQDAGSRLLGKWSTLDAAPVLLDLAKTAPDDKYKVRALRGYIGMARKFPMPDKQRAEMCQTAFNASLQEAEQTLVLDVLKVQPSLDTLQVALKIMQDPEWKETAAPVAVAIAQKLKSKGVKVDEILSKAGLKL